MWTIPFFNEPDLLKPIELDKQAQIKFFLPLNFNLITTLGISSLFSFPLQNVILQPFHPEIQYKLAQSWRENSPFSSLHFQLNSNNAWPCLPHSYWTISIPNFCLPSLALLIEFSESDTSLSLANLYSRILKDDRREYFPPHLNHQICSIIQRLVNRMYFLPTYCFWYFHTAISHHHSLSKPPSSTPTVDCFLGNIQGCMVTKSPDTTRTKIKDTSNSCSRTVRNKSSMGEQES